MEIRRGLIETEAVGESEIEGVVLTDPFAHSRISGNAFTFCGRPSREMTWIIGAITQENFREQAIGTCPRCRDELYALFGGSHA